ncbi:MAG TPA: VWA domain-containing protein [Thermoanaerobaculia bacterium]|jgi:VWFA-related protein|nr:VWA domain-containing protein [Thermoanaerobaculia bacterium]
MRSGRLRVWLSALAVGAAFALPAAAQFSETTDVVVIEVPVQVIGKDGEPVRGLTAADFEVSEGRKKLPVTGFEVLDLEVEQRSAAEMPTAARRHFLMLFDLSFSEPKSIIKARKAAADVVDALHPTDLVAVATYSQANGPQLILGFTPDRRQARLALDTLGLPKLMDRAPDPLRLVMSQEIRQLKAQSTLGGEGRGGQAAGSHDEAVLEQLETIDRAQEQGNQAVLKNKVTALTRSFSDLARLMNGVQGRKYVVYLSEGYDSSIIAGTTSDADQAQMSESAMSGEIWNVDSSTRFGDTSAGNDVEQMLEAFRRSDCSIQAVDIGGLRDAGDRDANPRGKDALIQMARGTGGEIYENFNDLSTAMEKMLTRTSVTYVLAVQPESVKKDGTYHKLKVELKNGKNGRVVHRPGYYAPQVSTAKQNPMERLFSTASQVMGSEDSGPIGASVMIAPFRSASDFAYVPVLIEVDGPALLAGKQGPTLPAEIFVYAMDEAGNVQDYLTQTMGLDLAKVQGVLQQSGLKFFGHLDLPPGKYSVRVLVRNGVTGAHGLRVVPLEVPAFAQAAPVLLPPFFPEAPGRWLMVREQPRGEQKEVPYPFMLKDQPFIPSSKLVIGSGQEAQVSLVGYNLGSGDVQVKAQVFGADGKEVAPGQIQVLGRESGGAGGPDRLVGTFKAPNLQPGEYTLLVTLSAGGQADSSSTRFVVKGGAAPARSGS